MRNKFFKKSDPILDDEDDDITGSEVDSSGPSIAAAKKSKIAIIAASSVLITLVIYFIFFKESDKPKEKLEAVAPTVRPEAVALSDDGKSPFEIKNAEVKRDAVDVLAKPKTPDVPKLPDLPADVDAQSLIEPEKKPEEIPLAQAQLPILPVPPAQPQQPQNQAPQQPGGTQQPAQGITDPRYAPIVVLSGGAGPASSVGYDDNIKVLNGNAIAALEKTKINVKTTFVDNRTNVVAQGKLVTAVLETAINTEVPGSVRGVVSRDVYGEAGSEVLIPRGSRLFGNYSSQILRGQGRVQINWTRLIRPDGVDLSISSFASDQFGRAGIGGDIDNKYGSVVTNSILTSILAVAGVSAAESLLGNKGNTTTTTNPQQGSTTTTGSASSQAVYNVSKTITDTVGRILTDNITVDPVIRVPQGTKITVIVNADMNIPSIKNR